VPTTAYRLQYQIRAFCVLTVTMLTHFIDQICHRLTGILIFRFADGASLVDCVSCIVSSTSGVQSTSYLCCRGHTRTYSVRMRQLLHVADAETALALAPLYIVR